MCLRLRARLRGLLLVPGKAAALTNQPEKFLAVIVCANKPSFENYLRLFTFAKIKSTLRIISKAKKEKP